MGSVAPAPVQFVGNLQLGSSGVATEGEAMFLDGRALELWLRLV